MLLAVLEVDAAAVCASVPIFWPVLSNKLGGIFVTQEIEIRRETRFFQMDEEEAAVGGGRHGHGHGHGAVMMAQPHSRTGSEAELKQQQYPHDSDAKQALSYTGSYSMKSMGPLSLPPLEEPSLNSHEAVVESPNKKNSWKWV